MGYIERELVVDAMVIRPDLHGAIDVDDQVTAPGQLFPGNGVVAETDDIGRAVLSEILAVGLRNAVIADEYDADFAPAVGCRGVFKPATEPISQPFYFPCPDRMCFLLV